MKKKVIIVGGGIAGLSAGIYAQKAGLESIIYEKHSVPGGQCTGWMREGHYIDNCICWLTCAKEGFSLWDMWKDSGICAEGVDIHQHEAFYKSELNGQTVHLWRDLNRAEKEMLEISPEDKHQIKKFFKHVRLAQSLEVPVKKPLDMMNLFELISMGLKELKMIPVLLNYSNIDLGSLAKKFKHPLLKQMLVDYLPKEYLAYMLITAYGSIASGGGGVPIGGSLNAALRMANRYKEEGGTLVCSKPVAKINIENNITTGVTFKDGSVENADFVICTTDTFHAFEKLIPNKYMPKALQKCYNNREAYPLGSSFHVAFSYDGTTDIIKGRTFFDCDEITIANKKITRTNIKNYSFEKTSVPEGKSLLQVKILEREEEYEYWKKLYEENKEQYNKEKMEAAKSIQKTIEARYPFTKGKLKIIDTWTPFTYTRFVNAYYGVFMTFMTTVKSQGIMNLKGIVKGINNLFLAGQWLMTPGGIPIALITGKYAVQRILKKLGKNVIINP